MKKGTIVIGKMDEMGIVVSGIVEKVYIKSCLVKVIYCSYQDKSRLLELNNRLIISKKKLEKLSLTEIKEENHEI